MLPIPPLAPATTKKTRRVSALDVYMKSDLKAQTVAMSHFADGRPDHGKDRRLSHAAFQNLDIAQKAWFQGQADERNASEVDQSSGDVVIISEHRRAMFVVRLVLRPLAC